MYNGNLLCLYNKIQALTLIVRNIHSSLPITTLKCWYICRESGSEVFNVLFQTIIVKYLNMNCMRAHTGTKGKLLI